MNTTGVCCIEFGRLEEQTVLMVRSLRKFGGSYANIPMIAVIGRQGAPLRSKTINELNQLDVRIVVADGTANPAPWLNYGNKAAAVITAERLALTDYITWFDSDILVVSQPNILPPSDANLALALIETPPLVTPDDFTHLPYWRKVCDLFNVSFDGLPWVRWNTIEMKPNFNSGLFSWFRNSGFAEAYVNAFTTLLDSRLAQWNGEWFTVDQIILTPLSAKFSWVPISPQDHAFCPTDLIAAGVAPDLSGVNVIHYSTALTGPLKNEFRNRLTTASPEAAGWLEDQRIYLGKPSAFQKFVAKALRLLRGLRYRLYNVKTRKIK